LAAITAGAADGKATITRADDYVPGFSSKGPTWYDGFAKPDVVAPGTFVVSTRSQTPPWDQVAYYNSTNYSFATILGAVVTTNATYNNAIIFYNVLEMNRMMLQGPIT